MDLAEAKKAAGALFDRLDRDRDGTLDRRELRGGSTPRSSPPPIRTRTAC
jgi:hypothetical protein